MYKSNIENEQNKNIINFEYQQNYQTKQVSNG